MILRPASEADSRLLFDWRNDPVTQAMSRGRGPVAREVHEIWFAAVLADPDRVLYIGRHGGRDIGMVRFDVDGLEAEVAINLAPEARGKRLSVPLLTAAIRAFRAERCADLYAEILEGNTASQRTFEAAGFRRVGASDGVLRYHHGAR